MILRKIRRGDKRKRGVVGGKFAVGAAECGGGIQEILHRGCGGKSEKDQREALAQSLGGRGKKPTRVWGGLTSWQAGAQQAAPLPRFFTLRSRRTLSSSCGLLGLRGLWSRRLG